VEHDNDPAENTATVALPEYPFRHAGVVLVRENKAVLRTSLGHLCGYCAFRPHEIPVEWHGNYDADALQYLNIHGGLTYCDVEGGDEAARKKAVIEARDAIDEDDVLKRFSERMRAERKAKSTVPYDWIVFGFDCGHAGDDDKPELQQAEYVMALAEQMEQQIRDYAAVIAHWRAADRDKRIAIVEEIRERAAHKLELGFGAIIGSLGGATEFGSGQDTPDKEEAKSP
jgi:hypothetical protein